MSAYEITCIVFIIFIRFSDAEAAWTAALHEVLRAAVSRDEAEAVHAEVGGSLPLAEAVLEYASRRGDAWLPFDRALPRA